METFYQYVRYLHILTGMTAFFVAPVALSLKKGRGAHVAWGRVFFWAMAGMAVTGLFMTTVKPNLFLLLVAVFSFHLVWSGYWAVRRRKGASVHTVRVVDWSVATGTALAYAGLAGLGIYRLLQSDSFGYVAIVFGAAGLGFSYRAVNDALHPPTDKMQWWYRHMQGMIGGYIAAVSAFSAVNFYFLPPVIRWLWPTLIGVPLLIIWERSYQRKFNQPRVSDAKTR